MVSMLKVDLQWPQDVSTSPWMPPRAYVAFTGFVTLLYVAMFIMDLAESLPLFGAFYLVYLTHWSLMIQTLTMILLFISTLWAYKSPENGQKAPMFVRFTMALWYISQSMSMVVMILYWTTDNPVWNLRPIRRFGTIWAHLLNWIVLVVHLMASNLPWSLKNGVYTILFALTYFVWSIIHFFLEIGKGLPCDRLGYPDEKCPIYGILDWHKPGATAPFLAGALVFAFLVCVLYWSLVLGRGALARKIAGEKAVEEKAPEDSVI